MQVGAGDLLMMLGRGERGRQGGDTGLCLLWNKQTTSRRISGLMFNDVHRQSATETRSQQNSPVSVLLRSRPDMEIHAL